MDLMIRPTIATSVIGNFLIGGILFGIETYVPLFIQGVRGGNASEAGQALTPLFLAWAVSVAFAAKAVVRWGFRRGGMFGAGLVARGHARTGRRRDVPGLEPAGVHGGLVDRGHGDGPGLAELHPGRPARGELGPARGGDGRREDPDHCAEPADQWRRRAFLCGG